MIFPFDFPLIAFSISIHSDFYPLQLHGNNKTYIVYRPMLVMVKQVASISRAIQNFDEQTSELYCEKFYPKIHDFFASIYLHRVVLFFVFVSSLAVCFRSHK